MHVSGHECCFCKLQRSRNCIFYLCPFSPLLCACSNHMSTTSQKARLINTTESFILGGIAACIAVSIHPAQTVHWGLYLDFLTPGHRIQSSRGSQDSVAAARWTCQRRRRESLQKCGWCLRQNLASRRHSRSAERSWASSMFLLRFTHCIPHSEIVRLSSKYFPQIPDLFLELRPRSCWMAHDSVRILQVSMEYAF